MLDIHIYIYIYMYVCICMYVYVYVYVYIHGIKARSIINDLLCMLIGYGIKFVVTLSARKIIS